MPVVLEARFAAPDQSGIATLSPVEAELVEGICREVASAGTRLVDDPAWVDAARGAWDHLPVRLRSAVRDFRRDSGPQGVLLLRGLPVDPSILPATPSAAESVQREATVPASVLMAIACGLGDPTAFWAEKSGALVHDVVPVPGREEFQGNAGSVLLSFHNENAFHPHRPDFVLLSCLRADHEGVAGLRTVCIRSVLDQLSLEARRALAMPEFVTAAPPSFGPGSAVAEAHPILFGASEDPDVRVDFAATTPSTPAAAAAMAELGGLLEANARSTVLQPGDMAIVDNRVTVHGRTPFQPRYDGFDRWIQRTFISTDIRRSRASRPGDGYVMVD